MDGNTQLRIANCLHRILYDDDEYFDADDAIFVFENLPANPTRDTHLTVRGVKTSKSWFPWLTDTGHQISDEETSVKQLVSTEPDKIWCGKFAVFRDERRVHFEDRFRDTRDEVDVRRVWVIDFRDGLPFRLRRAVSRRINFRIPFIVWASIDRIRFVPWKKAVYYRSDEFCPDAL